MVTSAIDEWRVRYSNHTNNIQHFKSERVRLYKSVQDMTVSANKTDAAIAKMQELDRTIRREEKLANKYRILIERYEAANKRQVSFSTKYKYNQDELLDN